MRSVSFVEHLELVFTGKVLQHALVLGNVTNEGRSQLVVGNISGDLAIFKGCNSEAWRKYQGLGMVSCIVIGDLCNIGKNVVFILTSEGWCHLMCFNKNNVSLDSKMYRILVIKIKVILSYYNLYRMKISSQEVMKTTYPHIINFSQQMVKWLK